MIIFRKGLKKIQSKSKIEENIDVMDTEERQWQQKQY